MRTCQLLKKGSARHAARLSHKLAILLGAMKFMQNGHQEINVNAVIIVLIFQ
jgi:hypothetical protein